ncbi:hypothetical protein K1719_030019 [Acacia pycnantha]|nr:hypothetical protein K1719_030019 [Acacia pycnantha]
MGSFLLDHAKNEFQSLVNLVKDEAQYLCCFNSYVKNFEHKKCILEAKHKDVKRKFQKGKGVFSFKSEAQKWELEADDIILIDTKIKNKLFFGWCPNCYWKYRRSKELAEKTQHIERLLERCNSNIVAGRANVVDMKYLHSQSFIHFESRESNFQDLLKALQDENCNMIGLQGMGGSGKTSMAKEVGHKLKESKVIDKFIFLVVSQPPDFKKIRGELAKSLYLNLDEVKEEELSRTIQSRITNMDQKLLIILDDVWVKFDLTEKLGIPFGHQQKGCNLLITTRSSRVCTEMGCQTIQLQILTDKEAFNLFEEHASLNNSSHGIKGMPQKIVKHCGGVPIAIVALARALKNETISVWKDALKTLEDGGPDPNLEEAYKCLKLSYDKLKSQKAKELLLISSLFPEDSKIPIEVLITTGIGLGSFDENEKYHLIRSEVYGAIMELIHSSLLLNDEGECVKMHNLVRKVALWIGENDIQSLMDSEKPIKGNLRYIFWKADKFPGEIDGNKLEYLSIFLDDSEDFNVADAFFKEMTSIKILILDVEYGRGPALSLTNSLQPLKSVQTLILSSLELGDISVLGNLLTLMTLWFYNCLIVELPKEFLKLKKLRSLEVKKCEIKRNNPFEVIEMCSPLEELTFVGNECDDEEKDAISHIESPLTLHRYNISFEDDLSYYSEKYGSMSRFFQADKLSNLVSPATLKQLVERAEFLSLKGEDGQRMWKNLVPDIFPIDKQDVMNDLIVLHLSSHSIMEYFIDTKDRDPLLSGFLGQLEILKLTNCPKLMSVFQPCTARSLIRLKKLTIKYCGALEYIIAGEESDSNQKSYYDSLFPSLKELKLSGVPSFIGIVKEYHQLNQSLATRAATSIFRALNKLRPDIPLCIVGDQRDARTQINYNSIFPKLKRLEVSDCDALEYLFPAYAFGFPVYLESLEINTAPMLKYVFGRSQHDDSLNPENQNIQTLIDFPALKDLSISLPILHHNFDILPKLYSLEIDNAYELEHVLIKQDEMEEIDMKDVLPQLEHLTLSNLPNLFRVCHGINFQKEDYSTEVDNCPNFDPETGNSQVKEKAEEMISSHMGEEITQQSLTKGATKEIVEEDLMSEIAKMTISSSDSKLAGQLVDEARAKSVSSNTLYQISLTSEKEVPIHTSLSLTALPTRDNTHACAKIFEDEEQEQGCLITSRRLRSGIKASSPLLEDKLETSIDAVTTILSEQTSQAILSSKASTSINQASSSFLSKSSDGVDHGGIKVAGMVQNEYKSNVEPSSLTRKEQESSYSKGQIQKKDQLIDSQPISAMPTTSFVTISQDEDSEGGTHIVEIRGEEGALILETPHPSSLTFKESDKELNPSAVNRTDSQKAYSKDELGGKEVQKETTIIEAESQQERTGHDIQFHKEEEEEREDDVQLPNKSQSLAIDSSGSGDLVPNITHAINSLEGVNYEGINEASVVQNESKTNVTCHGDQANPSNITQIEQETSHCRGQMVESRDCTESDFIEDTKLSVSPFYTPIKMMPSFLETNNEASIVPGDAYLLGFDKDWIESIKTKVFDNGIYEVDSIQKVLKGLDNDLKSNEAMLEVLRDKEVEAARVVEVAQQEHANIMAGHANLLKERQYIIAQRHQCWELIAAKNRHFGF